VQSYSPLKQPLFYTIFGCLATFFFIATFTNHARHLQQERLLRMLFYQAHSIEQHLSALLPSFPLHVTNSSTAPSDDSFLTLWHYQTRDTFEYTLSATIEEAPPPSTFRLFYFGTNRALSYRIEKPTITAYYPLSHGTSYLAITLKESAFFKSQQTVLTYGLYACGVGLLWWLGFFFYLAKTQTQHDYSHAIEQTLHDTKTLALTDPLTGISNRIKGEDALAELIDRSNRFNQPFSLISFDIDHFKHINDTLGHPAGDALLVGLCAFVKSLTKSSDLFVRWGGEEFLLILPGASLPNANIFAKKLCTHIPAQELLPATYISCSFGVVQHRHNEPQRDILARLDRLLYQAKTGGRNRVVCE